MDGDFRTAAVIGLGLIGGSVAREISACGVRVAGWDLSTDAISLAMEAGAIAESLDAGLSGLARCELIVIATPVTETIDVLKRVDEHARSATLVTDVGSTKSSIVNASERLRIRSVFVGSHPLAGDQESGFRASRKGLFAGAPVYLCSSSQTATSALDLASNLWKSMGSLPRRIDAGEHDRRMAWVSHLPQLSATALANVLRHAGFTRGELGPGGRDAMRLAASSPDVWTAICLDNAPALQEGVDAMLDQLREFRHALETRDRGGLRRCFETSRTWSRES